MGILKQIRNTSTTHQENTLVEEICRPPVPVASQTLVGKETFTGTGRGTAGTGACQQENQSDLTPKLSENEKLLADGKFFRPATPLVDPAASHPPPAAPVHEPSPCLACHSPGFWLSVYGGGLRCLTCEPPPGRSLVRRKLFLAAEPVDPLHPGGPWRRVLEPWEWHFGEGESVTMIVDATGLDDEQPVSRIAWQWDLKSGTCVGAKVVKVEKITA